MGEFAEMSASAYRSSVLIPVGLTAVVLMCAYLYHRYRQRVMERPLPPEDPTVWTGRGIDVDILRPRVEEIRLDYSSVIHLLPKRLALQGDRVKRARQMISRFGYFQHREDVS